MQDERPEAVHEVSFLPFREAGHLNRHIPGLRDPVYHTAGIS